MVFPVIIAVLAEPYVVAGLGAAAVGLGIAKRGDIAKAGEAAGDMASKALHASAELSLKALPLLLAASGVRTQPLWRPEQDRLPMPLLPDTVPGLDLDLSSIKPWQPPTIIQMSDDGAPPAPAAADTSSGPSTPAAPQAPEPPQEPHGWRGALRRGIGRVTGPVSSAFEFVRARWYLRWAPPLLSTVYAFGRVAWTDYNQEVEREALRKPVPDADRARVAKPDLTLEEAIHLVHDYAYDEALMKAVIPKMMRTAYSPNGSLVVVHSLLESFSMHPAVNVQMKKVYLECIDSEYKALRIRFSHEAVAKMDVVKTPDSLFESGDVKFTGHMIKPGIDDIVAEIILENSQLRPMVARHQAWMKARGVSPEVLEQIMARSAAIDVRLPQDWGGIQSRIGSVDYLASSEDALEAMETDFVEKNQDVWGSFFKAIMPGGKNPNLVGSLLAFFGASYFLDVSAPAFFLRQLGWAAGTGLASDANFAIKDATTRRPVKFCLPGLGRLCDDQ